MSCRKPIPTGSSRVTSPSRTSLAQAWAWRRRGRCRSSPRSHASSRAHTIRCAWRQSAGATSTCAARTAGSPSAKTGLEDLAMFRAIPGATVFYPSDAIAAERLTEAAARLPGICYLRTSRPKLPVLYASDEKFPVPGFKVLRQSSGDRATVVAAGVTVYEALKAYEQLKAKGVPIRVIDFYCLKPIDATALGQHVAAGRGRLVSVEDHYPEGGLGEAVLGALTAGGIALGGVRRLAVTGVPHSGKPDELLDAFGISARHIVGAVEQLG